MHPLTAAPLRTNGASRVETTVVGQLWLPHHRLGKAERGIAAAATLARQDIQTLVYLSLFRLGVAPFLFGFWRGCRYTIRSSAPDVTVGHFLCISSVETRIASKLWEKNNKSCSLATGLKWFDAMITSVVCFAGGHRKKCLQSTFANYSRCSLPEITSRDCRSTFWHELGTAMAHHSPCWHPRIDLVFSTLFLHACMHASRKPFRARGETNPMLNHPNINEQKFQNRFFKFSGTSGYRKVTIQFLTTEKLMSETHLAMECGRWQARTIVLPVAGDTELWTCCYKDFSQFVQK